MTEPPRRRHLPVIQPEAASAVARESARPWFGLVGCAVATLVLWAPLAALAQLAGRRVAGALAPGLDPLAPAAWLERASALEKAEVLGFLIGLPAASFVVAGVIAGWLSTRSVLPSSSPRYAGAGVALAAVAVWVLASLRMDVLHAVASLLAASAVGYLSGWLGHRIGRRAGTDPPSGRSDLDDPARGR